MPSSPAPQRPVRRAVSAGGLILDAEGRVVLTSRRSFGGDLQWGLPKGLVEPGETIEDAARREATEETGLEVEIVRALQAIDYWYAEPDGTRVHKVVHFFLMRVTGGDPARHDAETEDVVALLPAEAVQRASFRSERQVIAAALPPA